MTYPAAPELNTERLLLQHPVPEDLDDSLGLWGNAEVMTFIGDGKPLGAEEVWSRLLRQVGGWAWCGFGYWTVRTRAERRYVGTVGFQNLKRQMQPSLGDAPEIGWLLMPEMQGRGLAREAVACALAWADAHLNAPETKCLIRPQHERSIRIALAAGYRPIGPALYRAESVDVFARAKSPVAAASRP